MLDLCLLGTGGMMPLPYRYLTSLMARCEGSNLLIDCGEGTQVAIKKKSWSPKPIDVICFTHYHADHISGLPGLLLTLGNCERHEPIHMIGPKGLERVVSALRVIAPELPFEIIFHEITQEEQEFKFDNIPYKIEAFKVNHNVLCYGYKLSIERLAKFEPQKAKEKGIPLKYWNRLQHGESIEEDGIIYTPDMVMGEARKGISVCYTTDSRPVKNIEKYAQDTDLFICEGMYGEEENNAKQYKHMTMYEAAQIAAAADTKELWLTHYSPSMIKPEEYMDKVREIFPKAKAAKDLWTLELEYEDE